MLYLIKYDLRKFKENFNQKVREEASEEEKFKTLKLELIDHLNIVLGVKTDLTIFKDFKIFIEGYSLCFSYQEETGQPMKIRLKWRVNSLTNEDVIKMTTSFCKNSLEIDPPEIQFTDAFMYQNLALYWPNDRKITISTEMIHQFKVSFVLQIIKHEVLHHYLTLKGKDASDTSYDFIALLVKYDAYISKAEDAQRAYRAYMVEKESQKRANGGWTLEPSKLNINLDGKLLGQFNSSIWKSSALNGKK